MADDDIPDLEDFSEQLSKQKDNSTDIGDYTKPKDIIQQEQKQQVFAKEQEQSFSGLKKGFFNQQPTKKEKEKITEVKVTQKKNPLQIDEVQENMKQSNNLQQLNESLMQNKDQWLNKELLQKISSNPKLQKLFTNPEYLQAIQGMQNNPQAVMQKYKNNQEFMEILQEYMKTMGEHFQQVKPLSEEEKIQQKLQKTIETDPDVKRVLSDPQVVAFIEYLQRTGKVDFQELAYKDPILMKKIQILLDKKVLNLQRM